MVGKLNGSMAYCSKQLPKWKPLRFSHPKNSLRLCESPTCLKVCHRSRYHSDTYMFLEKIHPPKNVSPSHTHKKNQQTLKLSISGMTYRTWQLSVAKSWWITWLLPTSANVLRRLDACVTVAVPVGPRWKATWRAPVRGFQQVTYHQHPVMSLNRFGVGWRSGLNKILFWCERFWKGTLMSEKKTQREGERRRCKTYPKGLRTVYPVLISPFEIILSHLNASNQKKNPHIQDISHSSCMNP